MAWISATCVISIWLELCRGQRRTYAHIWAERLEWICPICSLVPRLPSPGNEKRAKTEGSLVEFKSRAPLPLLRLSGRVRIKGRSPERTLMRSLMRAWPLKRSNGSGSRDLNSTRLPSVLARFSFPGEGSLGTRLPYLYQRWKACCR